MSEIEHPLAKDTTVQYLSPRCPCSGKRFVVATGKIQSHEKLSDGRFSYRIVGERKIIPQEGIVKLLGK